MIVDIIHCYDAIGYLEDLSKLCILKLYLDMSCVNSAYPDLSNGFPGHTLPTGRITVNVPSMFKF